MANNYPATNLIKFGMKMSKGWKWRQLKAKKNMTKVIILWGNGTKQQKEALKYISRIYCKKCPPYKKEQALWGRVESGEN